MKRILGLLLLFVSLANAGKVAAEFRLKKDVAAAMRGWILDYDEEGFTYEGFSKRGGKKRIRWADLVEEDAKKLRIGFKLDLTEDEKKGLIDGQEIHFKGGNTVRGLLVGVDEDKTHRVRVAGLILPYPGDRILRIDEIKIKEDEAYSPDEIYVRRLEQRPPRGAKEHRFLADYMYGVGNWEGALEQYNAAMEKDPLLRPTLEPRLAELQDLLEDKAAAEVFSKEKSNAVLNGKWREAIDNIRAYTEDNPGARRRGERLISDIEDMWIEKKQAIFHRVKNEEFDRTIRKYLSRKKPGIEEAKSWATTTLPEELKVKIRRRLDLSEEEMEMFLDTEAKGAPHWASYWTGSFVVSSRAAKGKSTKRAIRGSPDKWWDSYSQVQVRASWLKAYAAERVDLFEVVKITTATCDRCGGSGKVTKWSPQALANGQHEWQETCPRCFGARQDRGVGYR